TRLVNSSFFQPSAIMAGWQEANMTNNIPRRDALKLAALTAAAGFHAAGQERRLRAGLIGCGGRGTGAAVDLLTGNENVELVAMADIFEDPLEGSLGRLRDPKFLGRHAPIIVPRGGQPREMKAEDLAASILPRIKVDPQHHFVGFDAYKKLAAS